MARGGLAGPAGRGAGGALRGAARRRRPPRLRPRPAAADARHPDPPRRQCLALPVEPSPPAARRLVARAGAAGGLRRLCAERRRGRPATGAALRGVHRLAGEAGPRRGGGVLAQDPRRVHHSHAVAYGDRRGRAARRTVLRGPDPGPAARRGRRGGGGGAARRGHPRHPGPGRLGALPGARHRRGGRGLRHRGLRPPAAPARHRVDGRPVHQHPAGAGAHRGARGAGSLAPPAPGPPPGAAPLRAQPAGRGPEVERRAAGRAALPDAGGIRELPAGCLALGRHRRARGARPGDLRAHQLPAEPRRRPPGGPAPPPHLGPPALGRGGGGAPPRAPAHAARRDGRRARPPAGGAAAVRRRGAPAPGGRVAGARGGGPGPHRRRPPRAHRGRAARRAGGRGAGRHRLDLSRAVRARRPSRRPPARAGRRPRGPGRAPASSARRTSSPP